MAYFKGLLALQLLLAVLVHLAPGERYAKYLRHFAELVLLIGLLTPVCGWIYGNDRFLEQIAYEEFLERMDEFSKDMGKLSFGQGDRFLEEYERALGEEVRIMAQTAAEEHGLEVAEASLRLSDDYQAEEIRLVVMDKNSEPGGKSTSIAIGKVTLGEGEKGVGEEGADGRCALLRTELAGFYGVEESRICIEYYATQ